MAKTTKKPVSKAPAKKAVAMKKVTSVKAAPVAQKAETDKPEITEAKGYKLISGIELPPRRSGGGEPLYPFNALGVGVSFFEPATIDPSKYVSPKEAKDAQSELIGVKHNRISGAIRRFVKRNPELKFRARIVRDATKYGYDEDVGIIVQRIA